VTLVKTFIDSVDAIQRVPVSCWLAPFDDVNGFPNYPVYVDVNGVETTNFSSATHVLWDGDFSPVIAKLLKAIGDTPSLVPEDPATITREGLLNLYQGAIDAQSQNS